MKLVCNFFSRLAIVSLIVMALAGCALGLDPASARDAVITIKFRTIESTGRTAIDNDLRAVMTGSGFLYIKALGGPGETQGTFYGPYAVSPGIAFSTSDIPKGKYQKLYFLYSSLEVSGQQATADCTIGDILRLDDSAFESNRSTLNAYFDGTACEAESSNPTIKPGENALSLTMLPICKTSAVLTSSTTGSIALAAGDTANKFVAITYNGSGTLEGLLIENAAYVRNAWLYDSEGKLASSTGTGTADIVRNCSGTAGSRFFLYLDMTNTPASLTIAGIEKNTWFVSATGGYDGREVNRTCTLADALSAAAADTDISAASPATIIASDGAQFSLASLTISKPFVLKTIEGAAANATLEPTSTTSDPFITVATGGALALKQITVQGNSKTAAGGLVKVDGGTLSLDAGSVVTDNTATKGAGVYLAAGTATMNGGTITLCNASGSTGACGGGVYIAGGNFAISSGSVDNNDAACTASGTSTGGGIYLAGGSLEMTGGTVSSCCAANGGGVYLAGGNFRMEGGTIDSCTADSTYVEHDGAGVFVDASATMTICGGTISNCTAKVTSAMPAQGGGVYVNGGTLNMTGGGIATCKASGAYSQTAYGGGIYVAGNGTFNFSGGIISGCLCSSTSLAVQGGAIAMGNLGSEKVIMSGGTISNCSASDGGGVWISQGTFTLTNGTIDSCVSDSATASHIGGGFYISTSGTLDIQGGTISNCMAKLNGTFTGRGGAIAISGGKAYLSGISTRLTGNSASDAGGAIYTTTGTLSLNALVAAAIDSNSVTNAASAGGALNIGGATVLTVNGTSVASSTTLTSLNPAFFGSNTSNGTANNFNSF